MGTRYTQSDPESEESAKKGKSEGQTDSLSQAKPDAISHAEIRLWIKRMYNRVLNEPVPDHVANAIPGNDNIESRPYETGFNQHPEDR